MRRGGEGVQCARGAGGLRREGFALEGRVCEGGYKHLPELDADLGRVVGDLRPELFLAPVDEEERRTVGADEISRLVEHRLRAGGGGRGG